MITGVVAVLLVAIGGLVGVGAYYQAHALPGASVAGKPVGGMTRQQVSELVEQDVDGATVTVNGLSEPAEVVVADAGIHFDVAQTVEEVFEPNASPVTRVTGLFKKYDVEPVITVKQSEFDEALETLSQDEMVIDPINGEVTYDGEANVFNASTSAPGVAIDKEALQRAIVTDAQNLSFSPVTVSLVEYAPDHTTESVQAAADAANAWMGKEIQVVDREENVVAPEPQDRAAWVAFEGEGDTLVAKLDPQKVSEWVTAVADQSNAEPVEGVRNINSEGTVVAVSQEGSDGFTANNVSAVVEGITSSFETVGEPYSAQLAYDVVERNWTERVIADGAENLAYPAAPGEKWIDVNLSTFTATGFEGATAVLSAPMVAGAPQYGNPTGQWSVYAKVPSQTMRGGNSDGSRYETPNVPWILYYNGGYALHGAYWRSQFGYDAGSGGSHGCINLPVDSAKSFYDWADVGDVVVVHH